MAPGNNNRTLVIGGVAQDVRVVATETHGCATGDVIYVLEDQRGHRSRWFAPVQGYFGTPPATGVTRAHLR